MKRIAFIISALLASFTFSGCAVQQTPAEVAAEKELMNVLYTNAKEALENQDFVLEANYLIFKRGRMVSVTPSTNFVMLKDGKATIQLASNFSPYAGPNGIGGITVEGRVSNVKMNEDKNGVISFSMNVMGTGVSATVFIRMHKDSNQCSATVSPNFNSQRITFTGTICPSEYSDVFKGRAL